MNTLPLFLLVGLMLISLFQYMQIAVTGVWLLLAYEGIGTRREKRDTAALTLVCLSYVVAQAITLWRGAYGCSGVDLEIAWALVAIGIGIFLQGSLNRRYSFYMFCDQENRRVPDGSPTP